MVSIYLLKQMQRAYQKKIDVNPHFQTKQSFPNQTTAGFTLLELITIVVMVGILAAIAAPGWLAFVNRQRVNKTNDAVLGALQEAQRQAKKTKLSYSVSFTTDSSNVPKIAIHRADAAPDTYWQDLGRDIGIKSGEVLLGTNLSKSNTADTSVLYATAYDNTKPQTVTFDHIGMLPKAHFGEFPTDSTESPGLKIVVTLPESINSKQPSKIKRCVIVKTLLGSMQTGKDTECE
jgi:type II secretory pathway pseudopilin PulG